MNNLAGVPAVLINDKTKITTDGVKVLIDYKKNYPTKYIVCFKALENEEEYYKNGFYNLKLIYLDEQGKNQVYELNAQCKRALTRFRPNEAVIVLFAFEGIQCQKTIIQ